MPIRILHLEDSRDQHLVYRRIFSDAIGRDVDFQWVSTAEDAIEELQKNGDQYQIYLVDMELKEGTGDSDGIRTLAEAGRHVNLLSIALTSVLPQEIFEMNTRGLRKVEFIDKRVLDRLLNLEDIRGLILPILQRARVLLPTATLNWKRDKDPLLDAEIGDVTADVLLNLLEKIEPHASEFTPSYLAQGMSGAIVCAVEGRDREGRLQRRLFVKLSRDRAKLMKELAGAPPSGAPSSRLYVQYLPHPNGDPWEYEGWHAIAAEFQGKAISLHQWLTSPQVGQKQVNKLLGELFLEAMRDAYNEGEAVKDLVLSTIPWSDRARSRMLLSVEALSKVLADPRVNLRLNHLQELADFVRTKGNDKTWRARMGRVETYTCMSHNDLHASNVLVTLSEAGTPRPRLTDTGDRKVTHWASDPARLCADLWVSVWDAGNESFFFDRLPAWHALLTQWIQREALLPQGPNVAAATALNWFNKNLPALFPTPFEEERSAWWQFRLALMLQFLAFSTYPDKPAPKRCLALAAADSLLETLL